METSRVPALGEKVEVSGMKRRPELNGIVARIVDSETDNWGRVVVRVIGDSDPGANSASGSPTRDMKMKLSRLRPLKATPPGSASPSASPSLPSLSRSRSVPSEVGSQSGRQMTIDVEKLRYQGKLATWKGVLSGSAREEYGERWHFPLPSSDATSFAREFVEKNGGLPPHKVFKKEPSVLRTRSGEVCPDWK
jgi:hypothetical protein